MGVAYTARMFRGFAPGWRSAAMEYPLAGSNDAQTGKDESQIGSINFTVVVQQGDFKMVGLLLEN